MGHDDDESMGTGSKMQRLRERIRTALRDRLEEQWDEVLEQWTAAAPSDRQAVRRYVAELRDRVVEPLLSIDSVNEMKRGLAAGYVEMKSHWTMLNMRIQHQTAQTGRPEESLIYRATCVSLIVQALEPLLTQEHVDNFVAFLSEPMA